MKKKYVIALDQGTTSSRAIVYDNNAKPLGSKQKEFTQYYPQPGWVEHDAEELFKCQLGVMQQVIVDTEIKMDQIAAIGITNQRETVVLWDKATGKPVYHAIVWQCRRTAPLCEELTRKGYAEVIKEKTGLLIDAYFSATKIKWILDEVPGLRERAERGEILAGTIDTWLIWKLSGGRCHVTDVTNACRTMLFNIYELDWDDDLLKLLDIPRCILPQVRDSSSIYCNTDPEICGFSVPIASAVGDQQAALFGQGCFEKGDAKNTYGTGCFMLMNTGDKPVVSKSLLTTIALGMNGKVQYCLEGSVFIGGAVIKWLRDELELISSAPEVDRLAESVPDANGCYLVPAFVGFGTPYWDMYARGTLIGLTRGVKRAHICRAALEGIAYEVKDVLDAMVADSGVKINTLNVDGGACVSNIMMQFQSDILGTQVCRPKNVETTALGAAYLAGLATGFWKDKEEIIQRRETDRIFTPQMDEAKRTKLYAGWKKAVDRASKWEEE
ncbi:MAG: glycerol kinase GlpK [Treponemataceae bacterium]|nr:glycerol kinase GlpK [Treponemataceae bacterium]